MGTVTTENRPLALVTGASTGIGYELARCAADAGYDLVICADEPAIHDAASKLSSGGARVLPVEADLATPGGIESFYVAAQGRPVSALLANAGRGLGKAFLDQDYGADLMMMDTPFAYVDGTFQVELPVGELCDAVLADMRPEAGFPAWSGRRGTTAFGSSVSWIPAAMAL